MEKQKKLLIYHHCLAEAGGCETFIYNLCTMLRNWYNILVVYDDEGYRRQVKALIQTWFDEEKVNANIGTTFFVRSEERLKYLLKNHMVKLL